jgi:hypothetical protein
MVRLASVFSFVLALADGARAAEPTVLLSMGQPPQTALQASRVEAVRPLALVLEMRATMKVGVMAIPTTKLPTLTVNLAWRRGGGATELVVEAVDVRADEGVNPAVADELRAAVAGLVGKVMPASAPAPEGTSPIVARTLAELYGVVGHLLVPLPLEPIGIGGQWEAMRTAERHGIRAVERAVYELLEWDGQTIRVDLTLDIGANPQTTGGGDRVTVLAGRGEGEIVVRLDQPGPIAAELSMSSLLKLQDGEQPLELQTETRITLSSP